MATPKSLKRITPEKAKALIKKQESCDEFIGSSVGDFKFKGVDYEERYVRVGCHRFLIEDVLKLAKEIK